LCKKGDAVVVGFVAPGEHEYRVHELNGKDAARFLLLMPAVTYTDNGIRMAVSGEMRVDVFERGGHVVFSALIKPGTKKERATVFALLAEIALSGRPLTESERADVYRTNPDCKACIERVYYE
jgi:hypothetical protein